jgi:hypothetical protein
MQPHPEIIAELEELGSPLAGFPRRMPFAVPSRYFELASEELVSGALAADSDEDMQLYIGKKSLPFAVPEGYFDALPEMMLEKAIESELPVMGKQSPGAVPAGYFDSLPEKLLAAAKEADAPAKVIPMPAPARKGRTLPMPALRWAAAALLILGIGVGLYRAEQPDAPQKVTQRALATIPKAAIEEYVVQHLDEFDTEMLESGLMKSKSANRIDNLKPAEINSFLLEEGTM